MTGEPLARSPAPPSPPVAPESSSPEGPGAPEVPGLDGALEALDRVYRDLAAEVGGSGVRCDLKGLCCDFEAAGHVLFATDLEVEWARRNGGADVPDAPAGSCPWFVRGTCRLREGRPLSCRVYFCDPRFADTMHALAERYHRRVVAIHERFGLPYRYARFVETVRERPQSARAAPPPETP